MITRPIFKFFVKKNFYMGPYYVNFTFVFDTTLILLEMTEIWPKYVAHESSVQDPPWIGLKQKYQKFSNVAQNLSRYF